MSAPSSRNESRKPGIIILGNAGAGKSYLCNVLVGYDKFESDFRPEAVTVKTEWCTINMGSNDMCVYNIPGLVEGNQEEIDRNKRQIMKAFEQSPVSVVIFVWTQIGGRVHHDDIIAFKALNEAYKFPPESLMFVVNNVPSKRPPEYEGQFIATLSNMLQPISISMEDVIFLDTMEPENEKERTEARLRLLLLIDNHHACMQRRYGEIMLQSDQLETMRKLLKEQQVKTEKDREGFQKQIQHMTEKYENVKKEAEEQYREMKAKLEAVKKEAERERARQKEEQRKRERREQERQQREREEQERRERRERERQQREEQERRERREREGQQREREEQERRDRREREEQKGREPEQQRQHWRTKNTCSCQCHKGMPVMHVQPCCFPSITHIDEPGPCRTM